MTSNVDLTIRTMTVADVPAGLALCRASRWNQTERDWRYFLTRAQGGARVAIDGDRVIGTVATLPYGPFTWISMVLVDPASRGRGVGTLLLNAGIALVPPGSAARLDATPAGEVLYRKLGFTAEYTLSRWFLDAGAACARGESSARPLARHHWDAVLAMDGEAFGASRADLLRHLAAGAAQYARVIEEAGRIRGYVFGRHGTIREHFGPMVADSPAIARRLLHSCLAACPDRGVFIDVPDDGHAAWRGVLSDAGFTFERSFRRMHLGVLNESGQPSLVYAIGGPEFG